MVSLRITKQQGVSIVGLLIGTFLLTLLVGSAIKLYANSAGTATQTKLNQIQEEVGQIGKFMTFNLSRGGGWETEADWLKGIQVCNLVGASGSRSCQTYTTGAASPCMAIPLIQDPSTIPMMKIEGFRLVDNVLQKKEVVNVSWETTNFERFCADDTSWASMHNSNDFTITQMTLCDFNPKDLNTALNNFDTSCGTILALPTSTTKSGHWIASFNIATNGAATTFTAPFIIRLYNKPNVGTL
jgi:hypothetical protein